MIIATGCATTVHCVIPLLFAFVLAEEPSTTRPTVSARANAQSIPIAQPLQFRVLVTAPQGTDVQFPPLEARLGPFDVLDHQDTFDMPAASGRHRTWTRIYRLESMATGELEIPSLTISTLGNQTEYSLSTDPIPITVMSTLSADADPMAFREIRSVVDLPVPKANSHRGWMRTIAALATVALAIFGLVAILRRQRLQTAEQWALAELDRLSALANPMTDAVDSRRSTRFVPSALSHTLRQYLELQFGVSAPSSTTPELLSLLTTQSLLPSHVAAQYEQQLELADQAKFAGLELSHQQITESLEQARRLVRDTSQGGIRLRASRSSKGSSLSTQGRAAYPPPTLDAPSDSRRSHGSSSPGESD